MIDYIDKSKSHPQIAIDTTETGTKFGHTGDAKYAGVVGTIIVKKGMKQRWTFKMSARIKYPQIVIMSDALIRAKSVITDNMDADHEGYGLQIDIEHGWLLYHGEGCADGNLRMYANQFEIKRWHKLLISMELDMTQTENQNGVLKYIIHNKPKTDIAEIRTDGEYSNVAYDDIDIDKKYRMSVSLDEYCLNEWIELIDFES